MAKHVVATGVGSLPGTDLADALALVFESVPELPFLPELPARGPHAEMVGRTAGLLVELPVELSIASWRLAHRPGRDTRRVADQWEQDLETLAAFAGTDRAEQSPGWFKTQVTGAWTMAAALELPRGRQLLTDQGAINDLIASLKEGIAVHLAKLQKILPETVLILQIDEPALPAIRIGAIPSQSGLSTLPAIADDLLVAGLQTLVGSAAGTVVHSCAADPPYDLIDTAGATAMSADLAFLETMNRAALDKLGQHINDGLVLWPGVVSEDLSDITTNVDRVNRFYGQLALTPPMQSPLPMAITPPCGLPQVTRAQAAATLGNCRQTAQRLSEEWAEEWTQ